MLKFSKESVAGGHRKIPTIGAYFANSVTDGRIILLSHTLTTRRIPPSGLGGDSVTDGWTDSGPFDPPKGQMGQSEI